MWRAFVITPVQSILCALMVHASANQSWAGQLETSRQNHTVVDLSKSPAFSNCWDHLEIENGGEFDASGKFVCMTGFTWATNANFVQQLHFVIVDENGVVQSSSGSNQNTNLIIKFPSLALRLFHPELISDTRYTNKFLDRGRWVVAPDFSSCVVVRQQSDLSDVVESWKLKPVIEKQWSWTRKPEHDSPPSSWLDHVTIRGKDTIAVSCDFSETVLLDANNGTQMDVISYGKNVKKDMRYSALSTWIIPEREWPVCGTSETKQIRILSLKPPHPVLKEVGEKGINGLGIWSTFTLESSTDGRLLLKASDWGSRLIGGKMEVELFDTDTWSIIYRGSETTTLSPNGKRLAIYKGKTLEIMPLPSQ